MDINAKILKQETIPNTVSKTQRKRKLTDMGYKSTIVNKRKVNVWKPGITPETEEKGENRRESRRLG
jgi:hypothetical protein